MTQGKIFFISGPSGVGKGTLINELKKAHPEYVFPPSCTTRKPRPGEIDGETYYFISKQEFQKKIENDEFLEYAEVHGGNFYGTLKKPLLDPIHKGKIVIREFDVQGFVQAKERLPRKYYESVFLVPAETTEELIRRIRNRAPISDEEIKRRLESMKKEMELSYIYDHKIISVGGKIHEMTEEMENFFKMSQ